MLQLNNCIKINKLPEASQTTIYAEFGDLQINLGSCCILN
jgi:hypothetical protein